MRTIIIIFLILKFSPCQDISNPGMDGGSIIESAVPQSTLNFMLGWTKCIVHKYDSMEPLSIELTGSVSSSDPLIWMISPYDETFSLNSMRFINNLDGSVGDANCYIPLIWKYSIDGQEFQSLQPSEDGIAGIEFAPGYHEFVVKLSGDLMPAQAAGHYGIYLKQEIVPAM